MSVFDSFIMSDASILASHDHMQSLLQSNLAVSVPESIHSLLARNGNNKLSDLVKYFNQGIKPSANARELWNTVYQRWKPYPYRSELAEEISEGVAQFPEQVRLVILSEYSFLCEHSSIIAKNTNFATHLKNAGVPILNATTKRGIRKPEFLERLSGIRWILGIAVAAGTLAEIRTNPGLAEFLAGLNMVVVVIDPPG